MTKMTDGEMAILVLTTIIEMSDRAEKLGGATCIAGIASLNAMQNSIQKNRARCLAMIQTIVLDPKPNTQ